MRVCGDTVLGNCVGVHAVVYNNSFIGYNALIYTDVCVEFRDEAATRVLKTLPSVRVVVCKASTSPKRSPYASGP